MKLYKFDLDFYKLYHQDQVEINRQVNNVRETPEMYIFEEHPFKKTVYKDEINQFMGNSIYLLEDDMEKARNRFIDYLKSDELSINLYRGDIKRKQNAIELLQAMEFSRPKLKNEEVLKEEK